MAGLSDSLPVGSTFDLAVPRRPGLTDLLADQKQDVADFPPEAGMLCSAEVNNGGATLTALAKTAPLLVMSASIPNLSGALVIGLWSSISDNVVLSNFTAARTSGGASSGDFTISWPANTFPPPVAKPKATINGTQPGMIAIDGGTQAVRIITLNASGAATDLPFTFELF